MLSHMETQRVKTRGPNPNPTTQAQSKRCLPLSTKTQNIIKILPAWLPNPIIFRAFLEPFLQVWLEGSRATPQSAHKTPTWTPRVPMEPKGAEMKPQGLPKVPKSLPTMPHVCQNGSPRCHNGAPRPPKVPTRLHKALQWPQRPKRHIQTARGRVLAAGDVDSPHPRRGQKGVIGY